MVSRLIIGICLLLSTTVYGASYKLMAYQAAMEKKCGSTSIYLLEKTKIFEVYAANCLDGRYLVIHCEDDGCKAMG